MTRPVSFDAEDYKHGIVVERFFNRMKNWRASRYDKLAVVFRGSVGQRRDGLRPARRVNASASTVSRTHRKERIRTRLFVATRSAGSDRNARSRLAAAVSTPGVVQFSN